MFNNFKEFIIEHFLTKLIYTVEFYENGYENVPLIRYFLTLGAARNFAEQVSKTENYKLTCISGEVLWLFKHKFDFITK